MADYVVRDTQLVSVADAIRAKGGTSDPLAFPDGFVDAVDAIPTGGGGGGSVAAKAVNFRDYDGTIVHSYTPAEFAALTAMPDNPDHSGDAIPLTAQGWNWSFANAQAYVAKYGRLEVGQMYATADGKTHVLIHLEQGRTSPILGCCPNGTVDVDWGDGTAHDTLTGTSVSTVQWTPTHEYAAPGDYDIKLTCTTGSMGFYGSSSSNQYSGLLRYSTSGDSRNNVYRNAVQAVYCADSVTSIGAYAFYFCYKLSRVTISISVTLISAYSFSYCYDLQGITVPYGVTSIERNAFSSCRNISSITIPNSVVTIKQYAISYLNIPRIIIPDSVTSIEQYAINNIGALNSIVVPDSVKSTGQYAFGNCYDLHSADIMGQINSCGQNMFSQCATLSSVTIREGVESLGQYAFNNCQCLTKVVMPDSFTNISVSMFNSCASLPEITIPKNVKTINGLAFQNCNSLGEIHFLPVTPPTVSNANAFSGIPTDCKIYVPSGSLEAYTSATNYPSSSTYTYIEE